MIMEDNSKYPLACKDKHGWYSDGDYKSRGGLMIWITPKEYLLRVRPLEIDEISRETIENLKIHMQNGGVLDPLKIYADGKEDGRHRAHTAMEMKILKVPVIVF